MDIVTFNPLVHTILIEEWLDERGLDSSMAHEVPELGLIAHEKDEPVCAGFLRRVEKNYAFLDSLITNPKSAPLLRDTALDMVLASLVLAARKAKVSKVLAWSTDTHTLLRSKKFGFVQTPHTIVILDL